MALIWQGESQGNRYKVTNAGKSIRLYRNGVFHTQYHPERIITGDIWELLLLASLGLPEKARVLVLGLGGGAIVNLLNHFERPAHIDVVELDGSMIRLCKRYFLQRKNNIEFFEADAGEWVRHYVHAKGFKPYDLVIEDLFGEKAGEPVKVFEFDEAWLKNLSGLLKTDGRLVMNFETASEFRRSKVNRKAGLLSREGYKSAIKFSSPRYQNCIGMFSRSRIESNEIRQRIDEENLLWKYRDKYYLRQLKIN